MFAKLELSRHGPAAIGLTLALGIPGAPSTAWGSCPATLTASGAAAFDQFGNAVSVDGDVAVIGAPRDSDAGERSGSAYVYRFDGTTWVEEAKLTASDAAAIDEFGSAVALSGEVAVIGAPHDDDAGEGSGSAYVYRFDGTTWVEEAKLTASDAEAIDWFGSSVTVSGDVAVIGASGNDDAGNSSGSAYVYRFDGITWVEEAKLTASDASSMDFFGVGSVSGDVAVVGALGDDDAGSQSGAAYVYRFDGSTWVQEAKLVASDAEANSNFGVSVSVSEDMAVVAAEVASGTSSGAVYVYRFDGLAWNQEARLTASDASDGDGFGRSTSASGDRIVVGASGDDDGGESTGSAYEFRFDGIAWFEESKLTACDADEFAFFGGSVSVSGDRAVIGARNAGNTGFYAVDGYGSAHAFDLGSAQSPSIIPVSQQRSTRTLVSFPRCDATSDGEVAPGFGPFDSILETAQQCGDGYGHVLAEHHSQIGDSSLTASGVSLTKASDGATTVTVQGDSFFDVSFELPSTSRFTVQGTITAGPIVPDNALSSNAQLKLTGPGGQTIFAHSVGGDGEADSMTIDEVGVLDTGEYSLQAFASILLDGDVPDLGVGQAFFDFTMDVSVLGDLDGDGMVGITDLLILLANWG